VEADVKHRDAQLAELQRQLDEQKRLRELEAHHHYGAGAGGAHGGEHDWTPGIHHGDDPAHWTGARARVACGVFPRYCAGVASGVGAAVWGQHS